MQLNRSFKAVALAASLAAMGAPSIASASSASAAIESISSGSSTIQSANRTTVVGGSMRMFIPRSRTQFVSITPPTYSAGCSGIDAAFGGISFINGDQLKQAVKNIMAAGQGYALDLAIRTLCPLCSDVMQKIRDVANWANSLAMDSCGAARSAIDSIATAVDEDFDPNNPSASLYGTGDSSAEKWEKTCKAMDANNGDGDWFDTAACNATDAIQEWGQIASKFIGGASSGKTFQQLSRKEKDEADGVAQMANKTYAGMKALGYSDRQAIDLIMSALGTSYVDSGSDEMLKGWTDIPMRTRGVEEKTTSVSNAAQALTYLLLVGNQDDDFDAETSALENPRLAVLYEEVEKTYAEMKDDILGLPFYMCRDSTTSNNKPSDFLRCASNDKIEVKKVSDITASENKFIGGEGVLSWVATTLVSAADNVASGKRLTQEQLNLINASPVPVYRMLKVAALYPESGKSLIAQYSQLIGLMLVREMMGEIFRPQRNTDNPWPLMKKYASVVSQMSRSIGAHVTNQIKGSNSEFESDIVMFQQLQAQLNQVDKFIAERAILSGSAGASLFSRQLSGGAIRRSD